MDKLVFQYKINLLSSIYCVNISKQEKNGDDHMAYYLAVENKKDFFEAVNIKKTRIYKTMFESDERYECTLQEIDRYTTRFRQISQLQYELYSSGQVPYYNNKLSIVDAENSKIISVTEKILFSNSKQYIDNPVLVIDYINHKFWDLDTNFFKELKETLPETDITKGVLEKLILLMKEYTIENKSPVIDELTNTIKSLVYNLDQDGKLTYPYELNYQKLRNIISFISDYEKILEKSRKAVPTRSKTKNT